MAAQNEWESRRSGAEKLAPPRPSLVEVLRMQDPADVVRRLALLPKQRERCQKLMDGLRYVVGQKLWVERCYYGGSFARESALNYKFDADVVFFLEDFDPYEAEEYHHDCRNQLASEFYRGVQIAGSKSPFCTTVTAGGFLKLDIVITGDPDYCMVHGKRRFFSGAGSPEVDNEFLAFAQRHSKYRPLVLLCKHWKHLDARSQKFTSYHIELLCQEVVLHKEDGDRLQDLFRKFLQTIANGDHSVHNPNEYNEDWLELPDRLARDLEQYASETLGEYHKYIRPGNNSRCPICAEQRFTSAVGAVQHIESGSCTGCLGQQNARKAIYDFTRSHTESQGLLNRMLTDGGSGSSDYGGNLYACPQCARTFAQMSSLMDHMRAKHGRQAQMLALGF